MSTNTISQQDYEIVIIQCCENCDTHQSLTRHSQWKYYQQFNELKKKIQKYVPNTIVLKNPIPDQLQQPNNDNTSSFSMQIKSQRNIYYNKVTQQRIIFPRIGAFEIYIYNVLVSSKLASHEWPNHYKVLQVLNQCVKAKREGLNLDGFSVYNNNNHHVNNNDPKQLTTKSITKMNKLTESISITNNNNKNQQQKKQRRRLVSTTTKNNNNNKQNKQNDSINRFRVYKSRQQKSLSSSIVSSNNNGINTNNFPSKQQQPLNKKLIGLNPVSKQKDNINNKTKNNKKKLSSLHEMTVTNNNEDVVKSQRQRYLLQSKNENRVKLPSLGNTMLMNLSQGLPVGIDNNNKVRKLQKPQQANEKVQVKVNKQSPITCNKINNPTAPFNRIDQSLLIVEQVSIIQKSHNNNNNQSIRMFDFQGSNKLLLQQLGDQKLYYSGSSKMRFQSLELVNNNQQSIICMMDEQGQEEGEYICNKHNKYEGETTNHHQKQTINRQQQQQQQIYYDDDENLKILQNRSVQYSEQSFFDREDQNKQQQQNNKKVILVEEQKQQIKKEMVTKQYVDKDVQCQQQQRDKMTIMIKSDNSLYQSHVNQNNNNNHTKPGIQRQVQTDHDNNIWIGLTTKQQQQKHINKNITNFISTQTNISTQTAILVKQTVVNHQQTNTVTIQLVSRFCQVQLLPQQQKLKQKQKETQQKQYVNNQIAIAIKQHNKIVINIKSSQVGVNTDSNKWLQQQYQIMANKKLLSLIKSQQETVTKTKQQVQKVIFVQKDINNNNLINTNNNNNRINKQPIITTPSFMFKNNNIYIQPRFQKQTIILNSYSQKQQQKQLQQLSSKDAINLLRSDNDNNNNSKIFFITGHAGSGKRTFIQHTIKKLSLSQSQTNNFNIITLPLLLMSDHDDVIRQQLVQNKNNIIFINNTIIKNDIHIKSFLKLIKTIKQYKQKDSHNNNKNNLRYSLLVGLQQQQSNQHNHYVYNSLFSLLRMKLNNLYMSKQSTSISINQMNIIKLNILPLDNKQIRQYLRQRLLLQLSIVQNNKQQLQKIVTNCIIQRAQKNHILRTPLYLNLYCQLIIKRLKRLNRIKENQSNVQITIKNILSSLHNISKWQIINQLFLSCRQQSNQLSNVVVQSLTTLAVKIYAQTINKSQLSNTILTNSLNISIIIQRFLNQLNKKCGQQLQQQLLHQQNKFITTKQFLIRNILQHYPVNLQYLLQLKDNNNRNNISNDNLKSINVQKLFLHQQVFNYLLIEGFVNSLIRGYKPIINVRQIISNNNKLSSLLKQKSSHQPILTHQLLNIIQQSQHYPSLHTQSSTAMTLLCLLHPTLSNLSFDNCQLQQADMSMTTFYNCSFKNTNLVNAIFYKSEFIHCVIDTVMIASINMFVKKYMCEYTTMCCAISKDNKIIVMGCGNYLILINVDNGKEMKRISAHGGIIKTVYFSNDGKQLISIANDNTLRTWDVQTFKSVVIKLPQNQSLGFNSNKNPNSNNNNTYNNNNNHNNVFFSYQSQTIAIIINKTQLKLWNMRSISTNQIIIVNQGENNSQHQLTSVCFNHTGEYILTGSVDGRIKLWNLKGKLIHTYQGHHKQITCCRITPSNAYVVSSSKDSYLIIHYTITQREVIKKHFHKEIAQICLQKRQKFICVTFTNENYITMLDFNTLQKIHELKGHKQKISSMSYDHSYTKLLSLSKDKSVRLWDFDEIMQKELMRKRVIIGDRLQQVHVGPILSIAYCSRYNHYATGHQNGQILVWDNRTNLVIHRLKDNDDHQNCDSRGRVNKILYDSNGNLYSTNGKDSFLRVWKTKEFTSFHINKPSLKINPFTSTINNNKQILQMKINQKKNFIVMSSSNGQLVAYYDLLQLLDNNNRVKLLESKNHGRICSIVFDEQYEHMAIGGTQKVITIYKIHSIPNNFNNSNNHNKQPPTINIQKHLPQHPQPITSLAYQGQILLISALQNGHIYIWNHVKSTLIKKIQNTSRIRCLSIYNKKFACLGLEDGKIRVIDLGQGKEVKVFRYREGCVGFVSNQNVGQLIKQDSQIKNYYKPGMLYAIYSNGNIIKWNMQNLTQKRTSNKSQILQSQQSIAYNKSIRFSHKAVSLNGSLIAQIEGFNKIRVIKTNEMEQQLIECKDCPQQIVGVEIIQVEQTKQGQSQQNNNHEQTRTITQTKKLIFLLKSGRLWSPSLTQYIQQLQQQKQQQQLNKGLSLSIDGDMIYIKDNNNNESVFYKSGIKKLLKHVVKQPVRLVVDQNVVQR